MNTKVRFVSNYDQIVKAHRGEDESAGMGDQADEMEQMGSSLSRINTDKVREEVAIAQAQNKMQYKRLADAMGKSSSYGKVQQALTLDKHMKGKGKKRKIEDSEGRVHYQWFA